MAKKPYGSTTPSPAESIRERKKREMERGVERVRKKRASYQRKIIGTALIFFIILIILCALLPNNDSAAYGDKWNKDVTSRQTQIFQSLQVNFK